MNLIDRQMLEESIALHEQVLQECEAKIAYADALLSRIFDLIEQRDRAGAA